MEQAEQIDDPKVFFDSLGGMHDISVKKIHLDINEKLLFLTVEDLYWNFEGLPEYKGPRPCDLVFQDVKAVVVDVDTQDEVCVSEARIEKVNADFLLEIDLRYGGGELTKSRSSIRAKFHTLRIVDRPQP